MAKILSVVGGRPQFIKEAITGLELRKYHEEILVHTGQHYDIELSENIFRELNILTPKYNLGVGSGSHAVQTAKILVEMEKVLLEERPDILLVYGDMNSTMGAALAASKIGIPVAHVEAGARMRVFDMPEEQNRIVTDHLATWDFACTSTDYQNLVSEGLEAYSYEVGDVMFDAVQHFFAIAQERNRKNLWERLTPIGNELSFYERWYFSTIHRPENTDDTEKLKEILEALEELPLPVVFTVHPRITDKICALRKAKQYGNIVFIKPVGYLESLYLTANACGIVTDSGGLQRESYWLKTPCTVVLRNLVDKHMKLGNCLVLAKPDKDNILEKVLHTEIDKTAYDFSPYGDGKACERIAKILMMERTR